MLSMVSAKTLRENDETYTELFNLLQIQFSSMDQDLFEVNS